MASSDLQEARSPTHLSLSPEEFEQPPWLDTSVFSSASFDADAFIAAIRPHVPLEAARAQLKEHLAALHSQLVELINRDYNDFVNLSTKLVDVDGAVLRMRVPLIDLRQQVASVRGQVAEAPAALEAGLKRRTDAAKAREALELLLDTANVLSKVEKLLAELQAMPPVGSSTDQSHPGKEQQGGQQGNGMESLPGSGPAGDRSEGSKAQGKRDSGEGGEDSRSRLLERIASEMNRLRFYMARGKDLPFVRSIEARVSLADVSLSSQLTSCLSFGFSHRNTRVASLCLRAFASLERASVAEDVFRNSVIAPLIAAAISEASQEARSESEGRSEGGEGGVEKAAKGDLLAPVYGKIEGRVAEACKFVLEVVAAAETGPSVFHFLPSSVLHQVHAALHSTHPAAFSPGRPHQFLANYSASMAFLSFLEGYYTTAEGVTSFRQHSAYAEFIRAWNLPAYYASRFREIASLLDEALSPPSTASAPPSTTPAAAVTTAGSQGQLPASGAGGAASSATSTQPSSASVAAPDLLSSATAAIPPLKRAPAGMGLSLAASVALWEALQRCWHPSVHVPRIADKFLRLTMQLMTRFAGWVSTGLAVRRAGSVSGNEGGAWGLAATPEDLSCLWLDLDVLSSNIRGVYADAVEQQLSATLPAGVRAAVRAELESSAASLHQLTEQVAALLADIIADRCVDALRPVRAIAAMYRVPTRPLPTRHSHYVAGILLPLKSILDNGTSPEQLQQQPQSEQQSTTLPTATAAVWTDGMKVEAATQVARRVASKYDEMAREVVATARRTESSLKLLQQRAMRKPGGPDAASTTVTDTDKITAQLFLDVQEFGRQLRSFSVEPSTLDAYVSLWVGVAPPDRTEVTV